MTGLCNTTAGSNNNKSKTERAHCEELSHFYYINVLVEKAVKQTTVIVHEKYSSFMEKQGMLSQRNLPLKSIFLSKI